MIDTTSEIPGFCYANKAQEPEMASESAFAQPSLLQTNGILASHEDFTADPAEHLRCGRQTGRARYIPFLLGLCFSLGVLDVAAFLWLRHQTLASRFVAASTFDEIARPNIRFDAPQPLAADLQGNDPVQLMRRVMNRVHKVGRSPMGDAAALYAHAQSGGGLTCGGMAALLDHTLRANRIPSRIVQLKRHLLDRFDTHVVVEALTDGEWIVLDPTFNVTYEIDGRRLGVEELAHGVRSGAIVQVQPHFHGQVAYPVRLNAYDTDWRPLFNNVLLAQPPGEPDLFRKLPPLRYWYGPVTYYLAGTGSTGHLELCDSLYFTVVVVLPISLGVLLVAIAVSWIVRRTNGVDAGHFRREMRCAA